MSIMNIKNIRKTIFIPLIALAILSSALVLTFSVFLYSRDMSDSIHERLQLAVASAQQEIDAMIQITQIAASGLAESKGIAPGMAAGHETLEELSQQTLTGRMTISYSMSYDAEGKVLHRTYSSSHGEDYSHLPHVFAPINGQFFSGISQSPTVRLGITTSAPVYDYDDNLVGAVSFGFRLDTQDVARRLKELIGYDITFFLGDERVSTTIVDLEGNYVVGTRLDPAISAIVLAGESYTSKVAPLGREILVQYTPMKDFRGETVGIMLVGFYMEEYDAMVNYFITRGLLITLGIIFAAVIIAAYITTVVERRLKNSMESTNKALEEKNALAGLEKILNGLDTMIYVTNPRTSEIIFINENMREHFGIEGNPVGQICYKVFQKGMDKQCKFCPCRTLDKDPKKIIVWQEKNTLTGRNYRNTDRYIKLPNGMTVHLQHSIDTTELVEAREIAEQSNRAKGIFLANMSHEVRTPMNAILGISEIQLRNQNHSPEAVEAFEKICDSGTLLLNIINDILDFSKIEAGKLEISNEIYDIPSLIHDTIQINRLRFESKTIKFRLQVDPDTPLELWGDGLRLRQILNNLLSNAFKYTEKGEVVLSASFEKIPEGELDTRVIFVVRDTGQGMNEDQLARLFEEYSRFNMTMNRSVDGTGLGMSITKGLIDLMGGEITVTSTPGKGTEFVVSVPQKKFGDTICGAEITERLQNFNFRGMSISKRAQIIYEHMPYGNVLVVDDIESNLHVAAGMMTPYGLQIELVKSGRDAIEKIKQKIETKTKYDIIFMDHMMPDMNGIEAVKIIREMGYESPIVALTANAVSGQAEMFLSNGFDGFISKPIDSRELNLCLIEYVRDKYPQEIIDAARINTGKIQAAPINKTDILKFFISDAENTMKVIEETLAQIRDGTEPDNAEKFVVAAHGLKSALANIGETRLSDIALELEQAGDARDFSLISKTAPRFLDALQTLVARHKPAQKIFAEISDDEKNFLREKLSELTTACRKFNKSAIRTTFAEINEKNWPQNISAALDEISKLILHSKFEKAAALAEKTAKEM